MLECLSSKEITDWAIFYSLEAEHMTGAPDQAETDSVVELTPDTFRGMFR